MSVEPFTIAFSDISIAQGNKYADGLADILRDIDSTITAEIVRTNPSTQDMGATLVLLLGTASATAVAKGVATWLARQGSARIEISQNGNVLASGLESRDAARIAEVFARQK